ncbi:MAG: cytochrome c oxidase subunit 3 family protein [Candidatus Neomarinimicrobiota bacterium]|nr:MAG: cytochrome c oxidase subunit 3 family protein [Candidatus Neomarinimicrobiota bacterium]
MNASSPHLQSHYVDPTQQAESAKLGMWVFLLTEILMFGGLFVAYAVFRAWNPDMFVQAHKALDVRMGTVNTFVLITSSLTMALSIYFIQNNDRDRSATFLLATFLLAATFMVVKYFEYSHKFHLGQFPGRYYTYTGIEGTNPHLFFSIYFVMTGLHGLHVLIGMGLIAWLLARLRRRDFSADYYTPMEMVGLFWHLVDIIWIFLFPLLYLIG